MLVGYARTSTSDQVAGLEDQVAKLTRLGCEQIFSEHGSGVDAARPELARAIEYVRADDVLVVTKPDRIARSAADLLALVQKIRAKGCEIRILSLGIDTTTPTGKLMLTMLAGIAEFERDLMLERQRAGIARARAEGKYTGRAPTARRKAEDIRALRASGMTAQEVADRLGVSIRSVFRISNPS